MAKRSSQERAELRAKAIRALKARASPASQERIDQSFDELCIELISEWIVGEPRHESATQQAEYWIGRVYDDLITDEQPDPTRMYTRFSLSLPRAQYIARLLRAQQAGPWRASATAELRQCLENLEASAKPFGGSLRAKTERFERGISRGAFDELIVLYETAAVLVVDGARPSPPRRIPSSPGIAWFSITAETVLFLLAAIRKGGA
jgi:hypothetical protein